MKKIILLITLLFIVSCANQIAVEEPSPIDEPTEVEDKIVVEEQKQIIEEPAEVEEQAPVIQEVEESADLSTEQGTVDEIENLLS